MNSLKLILKSLHTILPYFYFSGVCFLFLIQHFTLASTGPWWWWSALFMLVLALLFLIPLKFQFKNINLILGILSLCWSIWMLLALVSDMNKKSDWILDPKKLIFAKVFVVVNLYLSINLLVKNDSPVLSNHSRIINWISIGIAIGLVLIFNLAMNYW